MAWPGLAVWTAVVVVAVAWGTATVAGSGVALRAAPLYGRWDWHPGRGLAGALALAAATVAWGPVLAERLRWWVVPPLTGVASAAWTVALAASDGWSRLTAPLTTRHEYEPFAAGVADLGGFVARFSERLAGYPVHVKGHPPGPVVLAGVLDRAGLDGAGWLAAAAIVGWGVAAAAALVAFCTLAGDTRARRVAPALAILPAAVWAGTSLDGLFAGVGAVGLALAVGGAARSRTPLAAAAGAVLGVALLLTYGAALLVAVAAGLVVAVAGRPARLLVALGGGMVAPLALAAAGGFLWIDGLAATGHAYWSGVGGRRPGGYLTLVGNPAALALATGPAVAAGLLPTLRGATCGVRMLPAAVLAAVVVANVSQMSRGEVERIWLMFVPWLALAAPGDRRGWLAAQAGLALLLQAALVSAW